MTLGRNGGIFTNDIYLRETIRQWDHACMHWSLQAQLGFEEKIIKIHTNITIKLNAFHFRNVGRGGNIRTKHCQMNSTNCKINSPNCGVFLLFCFLR